MGDKLGGGWLVLGFFAFVFLLIALFIVGRLRAWSTRRQKIAEWAARNSLTFAPGPSDASTFAPLPGLHAQGSVTRCEATNIAHGRRAMLEVTVFDLYRATRSDRGSKTTLSGNYGTFALFEVPGRPLPYFDFSALSTAGPRSFQGQSLRMVMQLAQALGGAMTQDLIPLEGRPGFLLKGKDAAAVREVLNEANLAFFDQNLGWTVEAEGSHVLVGFQPRLRDGWTRPQIEELLAWQDFDKFLPLAAAIAQRVQRA